MQYSGHLERMQTVKTDISDEGIPLQLESQPVLNIVKKKIKNEILLRRKGQSVWLGRWAMKSSKGPSVIPHFVWKSRTDSPAGSVL